MPKNPSPEPASILDTVNMLTTDSSDSDSEVEPPLSIRLYSTKPRNLVQRRATITGASPTTKHGIDIEQFWKELKQEHCTTFQLRDKAASCAHGLDNVPSNIRPQTCLPLEPMKRRKKTDGQIDNKVQFQEKSSDIESTHLDDAKKIIHNVKERITSIQNCDDTVIVASKDTNKEHFQSTNKVSDSNNLSDTIVPLDECNNFISDTHSISKSVPVNKESGVRYVKERGKLDKSYSTPAYDLSDTENKDDKKLTLFEGPFCKIDLPVHSLNSISSSSITKTDLCTFVNDEKKLDDTNREYKDPIKKYGGNVAQKISDIEKQIASESVDEHVCVFTVPKQLDKNSVRIKINGMSPKNSIEENNQSNKKCKISDINKYDKKHATDDLIIECKNVVYEHPEVVCSKNLPPGSHDAANILEISNSEERCSSNSNEEYMTLQKFDKILQAIDSVSTQHTKLIEEQSSMTLPVQDFIETEVSSSPSNNANPKEDDLPNVIHGVSKIQITKPQIKETKCTDLPLEQTTIQSCRYIELPKVESVKKLENKSRLPPEPPPRKYYTKPGIIDVKSDNASKTSQEKNKPQVPERPNIKRELKIVDVGLSEDHIKNNTYDQYRNDSSDVREPNYIENSTDFIDEPRIMNLNDQKFTESNISLYNENYDKQAREEKYGYEKYEPFVEKFGLNQAVTDCYKPEYSTRNVECLDNITHSKQMTLLDQKSKLSEKDKSFEKSVVNRAMMVARSIGLHGSLNKSTLGSPRSNRKRNVLLTSKYN